MSKVTTVSDNCIKLIEYYECGGDVGKFLKAYLCPANVWTIGVGTTVYPNKAKVEDGDIITIDQAYSFLRFDLRNAQFSVDSFTTDIISQCQFDSLVSFAYNLGVSALKTSTLLKKVNKNPLDLSIEAEFIKWIYADGKMMNGLINRRKSESYLYFNDKLKFDFNK